MIEDKDTNLKISNDKINNIKFEKMTFDFSEFESLSTTYPKLSERDIFWLLNKNKEQKKTNTEQKYILDVKEDIYKQLINTNYQSSQNRNS